MFYELNTTYRYFSHYTRNNTATIAASIDVLSCDNITYEEKKQILGNISEMSMLLDLFDAGMGICMQYLLSGDELSDKKDSTINLDEYISSFIDKYRNIMHEKESNCAVMFENNIPVKGDVHVIKTIVGIIFYECIINIKGTLRVRSKQNVIKSVFDNEIKVPEVWKIFADILVKNNIIFTYNNNSFILEKIYNEDTCS